MFFAIKAVDLDLYIVMDVTTGDLTWGSKKDCMVFGTHSGAGAFAQNNYLEYDWGVVGVDFGF